MLPEKAELRDSGVAQSRQKKAGTKDGPGSVLAGCPDKIQELVIQFQVSRFET